VDETAKDLGFTPADYVTESYGRLYERWREEHRAAPKDMRFKRGA
jgi:hypothetical protein